MSLPDMDNPIVGNRPKIERRSLFRQLAAGRRDDLARRGHARRRSGVLFPFGRQCQTDGRAAQRLRGDWLGRQPGESDLYRLRERQVRGQPGDNPHGHAEPGRSERRPRGAEHGRSEAFGDRAARPGDRYVPVARRRGRAAASERLRADHRLYDVRSERDRRPGDL